MTSALGTVRHEKSHEKIHEFPTPKQVVRERINPLSSLSLETIIPLRRLDIPLGRGRGRAASMFNLKVVQDFNKMLDQVCDLGLNPYEIVGEISLDSPEIKAETAKRKSFVQTFKKLLRRSVKEHGLKGKVDVMEYNHGERFFVVGREI